MHVLTVGELREWAATSLEILQRKMVHGATRTAEARAV
jgi:hypothetical protein